MRNAQLAAIVSASVRLEQVLAKVLRARLRPYLGLDAMPAKSLRRVRCRGAEPSVRASAEVTVDEGDASRRGARPQVMRTGTGHCTLSFA